MTIVTGRSAQFLLVPKDEYIKQTGEYVGEFVADELWEMFNYFSEFGFGAAGKPEALNCTKEVALILTVIETNLGSSVCTSIAGSTS